MQALQQHVMQTAPNARRLPIPQSPPTTHAGAAAHLGRQHFPRQPRAQHEQDARECGPVLNWTTPALRTRPRRREERRDLIPEIIGEKQSGHAKPTLKTKLGAVLLGVLSHAFRQGSGAMGFTSLRVCASVVARLLKSMERTGSGELGPMYGAFLKKFV